MHTHLQRALAVALAAGVTIPPTALATNGYFAHGQGTASKAMAGVATALPQDTLVGATNPAGMFSLGNRMDLGVAFFNPSDRGYEANYDYATQAVPATDGAGNHFTVDFPAGPFVTPGNYESDLDWFLIPSFGYNRILNDKMSIGVSVFGNGGMNTKYKERAVWENFAVAPNQLVTMDGSPMFEVVPNEGVLIQNGGPVPITDPNMPPPPNGNNGNPGGFLTATTPTGINLEQLFIEVPFAYKVNDKHTLGIAPVFAIQRFEATGLEPFQAASVSATNVTNNGKDTSYGFGLHLGWYGELTDQLRAGVSYRTRTWMTEFDDYKGLFAEQGDFDIPAVLNIGLAYRPRQDIVLAFDYQRIFYGDIDSMANSNNTDISGCFAPGPKASTCLGGDNGLGFGWEDMDVYKFGAAWDVNKQWTVRGGVSYASEFAPGGEGLFNLLAPATIQWHWTLGATYRHSATDAFSFSYAYMPKNELDGENDNITGAQTGKVYMEQQDIEISWTHWF